jgi:hypothetical protein
MRKIGAVAAIATYMHSTSVHNRGTTEQLSHLGELRSIFERSVNLSGVPTDVAVLVQRFSSLPRVYFPPNKNELWPSAQLPPPRGLPHARGDPASTSAPPPPARLPEREDRACPRPCLPRGIRWRRRHWRTPPALRLL